MTDNLGDCELIGEPASEEERDLSCMGPSQSTRAAVARWVMRQVQDGAHLVQGSPGEQTATMMTIMDWIYDRCGKDLPDEYTPQQTQAKVEQAMGAFKSVLGSMFGPRPDSTMAPDEAAAVFTGKEAFCTGKDDEVIQATRDTPETLAEGGRDDIPEGTEPVLLIDPGKSRVTGPEGLRIQYDTVPWTDQAREELRVAETRAAVHERDWPRTD